MPPLDLRPAADRLPPGQVLTRKWPVLHYGRIPIIEPADWRFRVFGLVDRPFEIGFEDLRAMPQTESLCDIHCVTRWSRFDNVFTGVGVPELLARAGVHPTATHVMVHAAPDYTTNLPLSDLDRPGNLLATRHGGEPLPAEHGGPVRLVVPHLYFWKSAKWVTGFELLAADEPGFWERNGYHMRGDPWDEERYGSDDYVRMRRGGR
jgi:DMSO/TMAO reductase YedYZ molybdopterin-dependent catalytic subunit